MSRRYRALAALALAATLAGCSTAPQGGAVPEATATFASPGPRLTVHTEFGEVEIAHADTDTVTVTRRTTAVGKRPQEPDWHLDGTTLELGSGCGSGFVGLCEPTYTVTVPTGTDVRVQRD